MGLEEKYGNYTEVLEQDDYYVEPHVVTQTVGGGVPFERTRRITGYLVGTVDRFCNAKAKEVQDRVKHT